MPSIGNPDFSLYWLFSHPLFSSPWREALSLFCSKAFTTSVLGPNSSRVTFSIPSAVCHGDVFLRTWLLPICAYLPLSLCPPTALGVGVGHLQVLPAPRGTLDLRRYVLAASPQNGTWLWGRAEPFYGCREVGCFPLLASSPLLPGSWMRRRQAWRSWAGFRQERSQDGDSVVVAGLALCSLHLITSVPINPVFSLTCPSPIPFPCHLASPLQTEGPVMALTRCMLSLLLSQYFLVCSHPDRKSVV